MTPVPLDIAAPPARARGLQRSEHRLLLTAGDTGCAAAALFLALWAWSITTGFPFDAAFLRRSAAWWTLVPAWTVLLIGTRRPPVALSLPATARGLFAAAAVLLGLYSIVYFYAPPQALPRLPALYFLWEATLLTLGWRLAYLFVFTRAGFRRRAIVVGVDAAAVRIIQLLRDLSPDVDVIAAIDDAFSPTLLDVPVWPIGELNRLVAETGVTEIVVTRTVVPPEVVHDLLRWQERGVAVVPMAVEYEHLLMRVPVAYLPQGWIFSSFSESVRARDASSVVKRAVDILGALVGLAVLVLVLPIIAVLVRLDSGPPIFYRQTRLGAGGREFQVLKFRSMIHHAEKDGPRWAGEVDARTTRTGRWLRRSRLDELPQVVNVLRGEMSLVGPRPERPEFTERLERSIPFYRARLMVRPGLTGWAQVNENYGASVDDAQLKLEYDLYYIKHRSFLFDAWILLRTASTMAGLRGR